MATTDVLILGAGAAGLAAAAELTQQGCNVCMLEARERVGGRILTRQEPDLPIPIELGAEFIHGRSPVTLEWIRRSGSTIVDAVQTRRILRAGKLQDGDDQFEQLKQGLSRIRRPRKDLPFGEFLESAAGRKLAPRLRQFARALVEGFDAADPNRVSTLAILDEWSGQGAADAPTFRPLGGYTALIGAISASIDPSRLSLHLNTIVHEVRWQRGDVTVNTTTPGQAFSVTAPRAIVALPLGVLQAPVQAAHAVRFMPALASKQRAFGGLAVGPVVKVMLRFREPFWETADGGRHSDAAFFIDPGGTFPALWSSLPLRSSVLTAWAAGPAAVRLGGLGSHELIHLALNYLHDVFGKGARAHERLEAGYVHDWQADRFSCGAYSYVTAGGSTARKLLAAPLQNTLFFAGEATDTQGESGTVAGALNSGRRAAREVLRSM